jgi:hypothetical protein
MGGPPKWASGFFLFYKKKPTKRSKEHCTDINIWIHPFLMKFINPLRL